MAGAPLIEVENRPDDVLRRLQQVLRWCGELVAARDTADPVSDRVRVDRIAVLEHLQSALTAVQAVETVAFARSQTAEQLGLGVHPRQVGRGIADQLALACGVSPSEGSRRLRTARDLVLDLPCTLDLLARGEISGWSARLVVGQLSHLDRPTRAGLDHRVAAADPARKSPRQLERLARRWAYESDPEAAMARCRTARADRHVTLRPAPDTMSLLTAMLPVEQGVACLAALERTATARQAEGDRRGRGQLMADALVARLTGAERCDQLGVEVEILMPVAALIDPADSTPAEIPGHGPLPAPLARQLLDDAGARATWRRLFTRPTGSGSQLIVDLDHRRRRFTGGLDRLLRWRDQHCRDPYCDAPIRHHDHVIRHADGGPTAADNGRGVCARGNYIRELPGWTVRLTNPDTHTITTTTPTGHRYTSAPPEPP